MGAEEHLAGDPEALTARLFRDMAGALELLTVYLGERLGLYRALPEGRPGDLRGAGRPDGYRRAVRPGNGWSTTPSAGSWRCHYGWAGRTEAACRRARSR